ncbi:MAG TPA: HIRAN domain-containing protein [Opitutus sp.]|nr:HIRAN domain-containing protein [Opitutus sp.]
MTSLFLAWQDAGPSRAWFPIGRLDADLARQHFLFGYTRGAERAEQQAGLRPLEAFPDFYTTYESAELFPLFRNRVIDSDRVDFSDYLRQLDLEPETADPISILAVTGGTRQTDNLEVFPKIERQADGRFCCRFFLHGNRHTNPEAQRRLNQLVAGDSLRVALELNNPATKLALQIETHDYHMIGWAPRYLINDLKKAIDDSPETVSGKVVRINPAPAPSNQRILVELNGRLPPDQAPMSDADFQLIQPERPR